MRMPTTFRPAALLTALALLLAAPATPALARTYTLTVTNRTCSPLALSVDGAFKEAIPASTYYTIKGLKAGGHIVTAQGCSGAAHRNIRVGDAEGNAVEEFQCPHAATVDPYRAGGQATAPPATVIVPYDPAPEKVVVRESSPLIRVYIPGRYYPRHQHPDPWRRSRHRH